MDANGTGGTNPFTPEKSAQRQPAGSPFTETAARAPRPAQAAWVMAVPWLLSAGLAAVCVYLGFRASLYRVTVGAQAKDLARLEEKGQVLGQTNEVLRLAQEQAGEALTKAEAERKRLQDETARLLKDLQCLQQEQQAAQENRSRLEAEMRDALQSRDVTISELAGKLTVNILDRVLFASGEAEIKTEGQEVLRKVAQVLGQYPDRQIHVIGHTDNVPIHTARYPSNWELSSARALAAVRFLTEQAGVAPARVGAVGYGEFHPVADNATAEGRAKNRRIAIVVLPELLKGGVETAPELPVIPGATITKPVPQPEPAEPK